MRERRATLLLEKDRRATVVVLILEPFKTFFMKGRGGETKGEGEVKSGRQPFC